MIQLLAGLSVITLLSFTSLYAQDAGALRIAGQVVAQEGEVPLAFATVAVFKGAGDTLVIWRGATRSRLGRRDPIGYIPS